MMKLFKLQFNFDADYIIASYRKLKKKHTDWKSMILPLTEINATL